mgnify:FL=1|jgi:hypothetical protein
MLDNYLGSMIQLVCNQERLQNGKEDRMTISLKVINIKITKKGITLKLELGIPFGISKSGK